MLARQAEVDYLLQQLRPVVGRFLGVAERSAGTFGEVEEAGLEAGDGGGAEAGARPPAGGGGSVRRSAWRNCCAAAVGRPT